MRIIRLILVFVMVSAVAASSPQPEAAEPPSAEEMLRQMLPGAGARAAPLTPVREPSAIDRASGEGAVPPGAPEVRLLREGTLIVNRMGRLTRGSDSRQMEFTFEADGESLRDPPMVILPNLNLMDMENILQASGQDVRFRITGMLTEYRGRNHILIQKAVAEPLTASQF